MFFNKRGTGVIDFTVLVIFEICFSVFALKISRFSSLVSAADFVFFFFFNIRLFGFMNTKALFRFFGFSLANLVPRVSLLSIPWSKTKEEPLVWSGHVSLGQF